MCVCDSKDIAALRDELDEANRYMQLLDDMISSLPPMYASATMAVASGKKVSDARTMISNISKARETQRINTEPPKAPARQKVIIPKQTTTVVKPK